MSSETIAKKFKDDGLSTQLALYVAKQMMASYKKGFQDAGVDHDYKDNEHYEVLKTLPKEIKNIKLKCNE